MDKPKEPEVFTEEELAEIEKFLEDNKDLMEDLKILEEVEKLTEATQQKVQRHEGESMEDCVSRGIATLINEGKDPEQAAAIAYSMCGEGKNCSRNKKDKA